MEQGSLNVHRNQDDCVHQIGESFQICIVHGDNEGTGRGLGGYVEKALIGPWNEEADKQDSKAVETVVLSFTLASNPNGEKGD